jgi:hypothetical protein
LHFGEKVLSIFPLFHYNMSNNFKELRIKIPKEMYDIYRINCIKLNLCLRKQTMQMIGNFNDSQEYNINIIEKLKEKK